MTSASLTSAPASDTRASGTLTMLVMLSGTFMVVLDFFIVNVALPSLQQDLHAGAAILQLVVAAYGIATAAGLVTGGRLGDIFGRRRMFMLGMFLFALASLACGVAPNGEVLVAARVLQGLAGALIQPQVLAMLGLVYTGEHRAKAFAAYGLALGLGAALGQLVGGVLIHLDVAGLGWRSCFLINLPVAALALLAAPRVIPPLAGTGRSRVDAAGMALVALACVAVVLPLVDGREQHWPAWSIAVLVAAPVLFTLLARQQKRLADRGGDPLVAPSLFAHRPFVTGLVVSLVFYAGNASLYFVLALYLQQHLALGPLASGLVFTSMAMGFFLTSMAAPGLAKRFHGAPIARGAVLLAIGHALQFANVAWIDEQHVLVWMIPLLFVQGLGLGVVMAPLVSAILEGLPPQHAGVAAGVVATVQQASNAIGVALVGLVFYSHGFAGALVYLAGSALLVAGLWRRARPG